MTRVTIDCYGGADERLPARNTIGSASSSLRAMGRALSVIWSSIPIKEVSQRPWRARKPKPGA